MEILHFDSNHPIVTRGFRVSRAPPHHTLPAFVNPNSIRTWKVEILYSNTLLLLYII